jgi:hypothetical protein
MKATTFKTEPGLRIHICVAVTLPKVPPTSPCCDDGGLVNANSDSTGVSLRTLR